MKGSSYTPLPDKLKNKEVLTNIKNSDNKCFTWSVLSALHPIDCKKNPERIHHYRECQDELNFDGVEFPVTLDKIGKFERQNNISINVIGFDEVVLFLIYITKERFDTHVNLLLYTQGLINHYCLIKDLNKLLYSQNRHKSRMYYCPYCFHGFVREDLVRDHQPHCCQHGPQRIQLPVEENANLFFKDHYQQLKVPFVIYADFESLTTKIDSAACNPVKSSTGEKYQHRKPCGFSYILLSEDERYSKAPVVYRGEDAVNEVLTCLGMEEQYIQEKLK